MLCTGFLSHVNWNYLTYLGVCTTLHYLLLNHPFEIFLWRSLLLSLWNTQPVYACDTGGLFYQNLWKLLFHVWMKWRNHLSAAVKCSEMHRGVIAAISPSLLNQGGFWWRCSEQGFIFELVVCLGICWIEHVIFICFSFVFCSPLTGMGQECPLEEQGDFLFAVGSWISKAAEYPLQRL